MPNIYRTNYKMKSQTKKILKLSGIILGALTAVAGILIAVVLNFIFTSEKLTPIVLEAANRNLNAKLDMKSVELTFFSTFPRFGVQLTDGTLVSKAIRDTLWQRTDTLVSFKKAVAVANPMDYLRQQKISIHRLALEHADIYAYKNKDGIANWDITVPDTVQSASSPAGDAMNISELDIRQISIKHVHEYCNRFLYCMGHRPYPESQYEERPFHAGGRFPQQEPSLLARRAVVGKPHRHPPAHRP